MQLLLNVLCDAKDYPYDVFAVVNLTPDLIARAQARREAFRQVRAAHADLVEMRFHDAGAVYFTHHASLWPYCAGAGVHALGELLEDELAVLDIPLEVPPPAVLSVELPQMVVYEEAIYFITRPAGKESDAEVYTAVITFALLEELVASQTAAH